MDHSQSSLRYVDADDVEAGDIDFDGLKVRNSAFEKLGDVEGFIVDSASRRPYYVVVDSGGWFKSKDFLVPIGHARLDDDRDALVVDIPKDRIERFPGFDRSTFDRLQPADIQSMNDEICSAVGATTIRTAANESYTSAWSRPDYRQPEWWTMSAVDSRPLGGDRTYAGTADYPSTTAARTTGDGVDIQRRDRDQDRDRHLDRELVTARETDSSPHLDGRAQPGDVLGVETGGERTHIGETAEDEDKRRLDAERAVAKERNKG